MDEATVERIGVQPLLDELATIDAAADADALAAVIGDLQRTGVGGGTGAYIDTDSKDSTRYLLHLSQSGLGLPDESYYRDEQHAEILAAYPRHIATMFAPRLRRRAATRRVAGHRRAHRRAGVQAGRRALGRRQAARRRPHLQPAQVHRSARRGARLRLGRLGRRRWARPRRWRRNSLCANPTTSPRSLRCGPVRTSRTGSDGPAGG